jgi:ribosomal protein S27E
MTVFNYARWVAKEITGPKNIDKKIFIVGGAGDGKSMTAITLARAIAKWLSYYIYGDFTHSEEFFSLEKESIAKHIAVISTDDLIKLMTTPAEKNSIRIIDDCGTSIGFTNRRSMSSESLDIASIYGTNRVRNGVLIIPVQDANFTDIRMRMLANEIIDLTDYYQEGPFRMAKLWKIKKDRNSKDGYVKRRFMTYEHGQWVTQESIACYMADTQDVGTYDKLRVFKEDENAQKIYSKYNMMKNEKEMKMQREKCPQCGSTRLYYGKNNSVRCNACGKYLSHPDK